MSDSKLPIPFRLLKIETRQFAMLAEFYKTDKPVQFITGFGYGANQEQHAIGMMMTIRFLHENESPFLLIEGGVLVQLNPEKWSELKTDDNTIRFPVDFTQHIATLSVGAMRGVMHEKTRNTQFNKFIIPPVNVTELLKSDFILSLSNQSAPAPHG